MGKAKGRAERSNKGATAFMIESTTTGEALSNCAGVTGTRANHSLARPLMRCISAMGTLPKRWASIRFFLTSLRDSGSAERDSRADCLSSANIRPVKDAICATSSCPSCL
ncbi:hypothetical protein D9M68_972520 [compost metagenome]